ncbi:MAG: BMP family ABC transporter substrate-binding protein [Candidatus Eisenbacteria bacterium]|nr:BMP family ABC transporter substrate-binding protein [Candidatus Eisenbacteria bacterium]
MKKAILLFMAFSLVVTFANCAKKKEEAAKGVVKAGLVFDVGGRGDKSFNDAALRGLERAKQELGIEFQYIEPGEGSDRESALRTLASEDFDIIFGVGFIFTDDITAIAKEFPGRNFACVDYSYAPGQAMPPNLVGLKFKEEEGSFLVGAIAALLTKTNKVGFIGGMESALIHKFEAGYKAGVKYANPGCSVVSAYAGVTGNAFKNPIKGKEIALSMYGQGADIIYHASGSTGLGVFEAARVKEKLAIGVDSDQYGEAPGNILTSMIKKVDVAVFETIKSVKDKTFKGEIRVMGLREGGVDYVYDANNKSLIPDPVREKVEEIRKKIVSGEIKVPQA